jgi:hypothetical protein
MRVLIGLIILALAVGEGINMYLGWGVFGFGLILQGVFMEPPFELTTGDK